MGRCAGVAEMVTVDKSFDQCRSFNSVTLRDVFAKVLIVLVEDDDVSLVFFVRRAACLPLFVGLAGIIQSFLALSQRGWRG